MEEYYFSANVDNETTLHIAPLTDEKIDLSGQVLNDRSGYFLYETRHSQQPTGVRIIAQVLSEDAALELSRILKLA